MMGLAISLRAAARVLMLIVLGTLTLGCTLIGSSTLYVPETAGIVRSREIVGEDLRYGLTDGQVIVVPLDGHFIGRQPAEDDLILLGSQPDRWVMHVRLVPPQENVNPAGCYQLFGAARATATHVYQAISDSGEDVEIVFPKSADWADLRFLDDSDRLRGERTCINNRGEAFDRH